MSEGSGKVDGLGDRHELDISAEEMKRLQVADTSLQDVRKMAEERESRFGVGFFLKYGLLYRRHMPRGQDGERVSVEQLVLPQKCRGSMMRLAHSIPMAGHLRQEQDNQESASTILLANDVS